MSSSLTLRQRQQQRKADEDRGPDGPTPRSSPPGLSATSGSSFSFLPPISPTSPPLPVGSLKPSPLAHRRRSKPAAGNRPTTHCLTLRSAALWILLLLITSCFLLYNALPSPTFPRLMLSSSSGLTLRRAAQISDASSVIFHPLATPLSSSGACVPAAAFKSSHQFLAEHSLHPDLGGLYIDPLPESLVPSSWRRVIHASNDRRSFDKDRERLMREMDVHPEGVGRRYEDDFEYAQKHQCRRNNWRSKKLPNCNAAHELFTLDRPAPEGATIEYKGHGAFRSSWLFSSGNSDITDEFVLKALRLKSSLQFSLDMMYQIHKEAIIMERLTSSVRIVDIFGFCGTTILAEHMSKQITGDIVWGSEDWEGYAGWMSQKELDKLQKDDVHPMNNLTNDEKLDLAIVMAESIADIHGFEGGVIVHGDIHPIQWLQNPKGQVKLNDFNNGEILDFYPKDNDYCKIYRCYGGTYRSPEEFRCMDSNEAMDTYSMGNNIYILLVGLWPFYQYDPDDSRTVQKKLINNSEKPYVDPRYRNRSDIEAGLVQIMELCWEWDLEKRVPIFEVVRQLYELRDRVRGKKPATTQQ